MVETIAHTHVAASGFCELAPDFYHNGLAHALKSGLALQDIPLSYRTTAIWESGIEELRQTIEEHPHIYLDLDASVQRMEELAHQALVSPNSNAVIHAKTLHHFPCLSSQSRDVLISIAERGSLELLGNSLASNSIWCDDEQVMKAVIRRDGSFVWLASTRLKKCPTFLREAITTKSTWHLLRSADPEVLAQHPNIILDAVSDGRIQHCQHEHRIPDILWTNKEFCLEWLKRGGPANVMLLEKFGWREDSQIALAVARYQWYTFRCLGEGLRSNRAFVLEALQVNGMVILSNIDPLLRQDLQVAATAIRSIGRIIQVFHLDELRRALDFKSLRQQLQCKLGFLEFKRGMERWDKHQEVYPPRCFCLSMLNCGLETKEGIQQQIGEYVGVPEGPDLYTLYQEANDTLLHYAAVYCI